MVAGINKPEEIDPSGVRKLLRLINSLRDSPAGSVIYRQLECMLDDIATNHLKAEIAYAGFVSSLLDAFAAALTPGSSRYVQVRLLQARLQPPLTATELSTLSEFVTQCADEIRETRDAGSAAFTAAISPLLHAFGIEEPVTAVSRIPGGAAAPAGVLQTSLGAMVPPKQESQPEPAALTDEEADLSPEATDDEAEVDEPYEEDDDASAAIVPAMGGEDYHQQLESRREDIHKLQTSLGQQVMETITQNEEFGVILEVVMAELRQAEDVAGIENARWTLIREIEKLMKGHNELADKLDSTHHYLQLVESDSRELTDELSRVRMLSLTDELTGLANRRAFLRRLEDEVARVQRYGFPLSFALMDLDHFKSINDEFGHAAGDEVLRVYAKNILSVFRHHDMVARYGGEEFAVLLPNTDADGAIRALNKVKRRAGETRWQSNGAISQVPSFSAGVSLFKPGESASAFIERADKALYRAKRLGRDRIELDITYETEESRRSPRRRSTDL
jgi:diguanylate cyclase (GGDEF)-like protein